MNRDDLMRLANGPMVGGPKAPEPNPAKRGPHVIGARVPTPRRGHAGPPGSGPAGETCGSCGSLHRREMYSGRGFYKCELRRADWTGGRGSDVSVRDAACLRWSPRPVGDA